VYHLPCSWIYIGQAAKILTECKLHNVIQCTNSGKVWISIADTNLRYNLKKSHTRKTFNNIDK